MRCWCSTTTMNLPTAITLLILSTATLVAGQNVTFTNTTTTVITTVITTTTNNTSNATMPPAPPPNTTTTATTTTTSATPFTISSRITTSSSDTWGPLMYCWFPCYGGTCGGGYPVPQIPSSGGTLSWWFGFQFQWSRSTPCPKKGGRNRRRKGC